MKKLTHVPQGQHKWHVHQIYIYIYIYDRETHQRSYEGQIKGSYLVGKLQRERGPAQISDQIHGKVSLTEAPKNTQQ